MGNGVNLNHASDDALEAVYETYRVHRNVDRVLASARRIAEEHGMTFAPKLNWSPEYSPPRDPDAVKHDAAVTAASLDEHRTSSDDEYLPACFQLWDEPQVNWDGKILGCCVNYWGELGGNALTEPVAVSANGEAIRHARAMVVGGASAEDGIPCPTCKVFTRMRETGASIDPRHAAIRRAARGG
jgi:hypothetical protein